MVFDRILKDRGSVRSRDWLDVRRWSCAQGRRAFRVVSSSHDATRRRSFEQTWTGVFPVSRLILATHLIGWLQHVSFEKRWIHFDGHLDYIHPHLFVTLCCCNLSRESRLHLLFPGVKL